MFDGFVSSDESLVSAQLWDAGVKYALADHQFVAMYVPMLSAAFWQQLTPALQKMMTDIWAQNIATYRANMAAVQARARTTLESHKIKFSDPTPQQTASARQQMLKEQDELVKTLKISPEMVKQVMAAIGS